MGEAAFRRLKLERSNAEKQLRCQKMMSLPNLHWVLLATLASVGCDSTVCDDALDKAESCGLQEVELSEAAENCAEFAACQGQCIVESSCNDLKELSKSPFAQNELASCLFECGE